MKYFTFSDIPYNNSDSALRCAETATVGSITTSLPFDSNTVSEESGTAASVRASADEVSTMLKAQDNEKIDEVNTATDHEHPGDTSDIPTAWIGTISMEGPQETLPSIAEEDEEEDAKVGAQIDLLSTEKIPTSPMPNPLGTEIELYQQSPMKLYITVNDRVQLEAQVDSGADISILNKSDLDNIPKSLYYHFEDSLELFDVQGYRLDQETTPICLNFSIGGIPFTNIFYVTKRPTLLGLDFMKKHNASIITQDGQHRLFVNGHNPQRSMITVKPTIKAIRREAYFGTKKLPPGRTLMPGKSDLPTGYYEFPTEGMPYEFREPVYIDERGQFEAMITNLTAHDLEVDEDVLVAAPMQLNASPYSPYAHSTYEQGLIAEDKVEPSSLPFYADVKTEDWRTVVKSWTHIPPDCMALLWEYFESTDGEVCSKNEYDYGCAKDEYGIFHDIKLKPGSSPVKMKPKDLNPVRNSQVLNNFKLLEKIDHVKCEPSEWGQTVLVVEKRGSEGNVTIRIVYNGVAVNAQTVPEHFENQKISSIFEDMSQGDCDYVSLMDIRNSFGAIKCTPETAKINSCILATAQYSLKRMPFGNRNSPSVFIRYISKAFETVNRRYDCNGTSKPYFNFYTDDIICYSKDPIVHTKQVITILEAIRRAGLKIRLSKTTLLSSTGVEFLGKKVTRTGVQALDRHIQAVRDFPIVRNQKDVMRFCGLALWNANLIWKFAEKMKPLFNLLKKNVRFEVTDEVVGAMREVKDAMARAFQLYRFRFELPLYCCVDASSSTWAYYFYQIKSYRKEDMSEARQEFLFERQFTDDLGDSQDHPILPKRSKNDPERYSLGPISKFLLKRRSKILSGDNSSTKVVPDDSADDDGIDFEHTKLSDFIDGVHDENGLEAFLQEDDMIHLVLPVAMGGGTFSSAQGSWVILEKEAFAAISSMAALEHLLPMFPAVYLLSDSQCLIWLLRTIKLSSAKLTKLQRWTIRFYEMMGNIVITGIRSNVNLCADAVTRAPFEAYKVVETRGELKAKKIMSAFPLGSVIKFEDIERLVDDYINDRIDPQPSRMSDEDLAKHVNSSRAIKKRVSVLTSNVKFLVGDEHLQEMNERLPSSDILGIQAKAINSEFTRELDELLSLENFIKYQKEDPVIQDLRKGIGSPEFDKHYFVRSDLVYRYDNKKSGDNRDGLLYIPKFLVGPLIAKTHIGLGHVGHLPVYKVLSLEYYRPKLRRLCNLFTISCHLCAITVVSREGRQRLYQERFATTVKNRVISIDMLEKLPPNAKQETRVLVAIEHGTNYKILTAMGEATGARVAKIIEEKIFAFLGAPIILFSDRGTNLCLSKEVIDLCHRYNVHPFVSVSQRPQAHGTIEVAVKAVSNLIRHLSAVKKMHFSKLLPYIQLTLNNQPLPSLNYLTSQYCLMGTSADNSALMTEADLLNFKDQKEIWKLHDDYVQEQIAIYQKGYEKKRNAFSNRYKSFPALSWVYHLDFRPKEHQKVHPRYHSTPMQVVREYPSALILKTFDQRIVKVSKDNVKRCHERSLDLFHDLPLATKFQVGDAFTYEEFNQYIDENVVPKFYKDFEAKSLPPLVKRKTRSETQREEELRKILDGELSKKFNEKAESAENKDKDGIDIINLLDDDDDDVVTQLPEVSQPQNVEKTVKFNI